jgi:hypothetical protein
MMKGLEVADGLGHCRGLLLAMFRRRVLPPNSMGMKLGQDHVQWQGLPLAVLNLSCPLLAMVAT